MPAGLKAKQTGMVLHLSEAGSPADRGGARGWQVTVLGFAMVGKSKPKS